MASDASLRRWRGRYARLLRFYPERFRVRFGESMEQTFADLCRLHRDALFGFIVWTFAETFAAVIRENVTHIRRGTMTQDSTRFLKTIRLSAVVVGALMVSGILTLMVLARGKDEDITGIVAPALLVTFVSGVVAVVATVLQKRGEHRGAAH